MESSGAPGTPPDELPGAGGPGPSPGSGVPFGGLRNREWLGRSLLWGELRLTRALYSVLEVHVAAQAARVRQPWSRTDLPGGFRFAAAAGARANIPFGPLSFDWGVAEGDVHRITIAVGESF